MKLLQQITIAGIIILFAPMNISFGQKKNNDEVKQTKIKPSKTGTAHFKELEQMEKRLPPDTAKVKKIKSGPTEDTEVEKVQPIPRDAIRKTFKVSPKSTDSAKLKKRPNPQSAGLFPAIIDNLTFIPPDLGGAAGPNHVMTTLNSQVRIQNKSGTTASTVSLFTFFSPVSTGASFFPFDPRCVYDPYSQRWIVTAFADPMATTATVLVAVSNTNDPTGTWTYSSYDADAANLSWIDFPCIGFNKNWLVITGYQYARNGAISGATNAANCQITSNNHGLATGMVVTFFGVGGMTQLNGNNYTITVTSPNTFTLNANSTAFGAYTTGGTWSLSPNCTMCSGQIYVFDKNALYAGPTSPDLFSYAAGYRLIPAVTYDNTTNDLTLVKDWNGTAAGGGSLRLFTITGTPAAPAFNISMLFPTASVNWQSQPAGGANFAPQQGSAQLIQLNSSHIQNAVVRNGFLWCTQTVFLPATGTATRSSIQWWQINPGTGVVQQFGRIDDATGANFYAFPSIAVNKYEDVLIGYSSFSSTRFASANYSYRHHTDPLNTLQPDFTFKSGLASYFKTDQIGRNRWGDYSATVIDPDEFTLWTLQEYAETQTTIGTTTYDRWGTEWTSVVPQVAELFSKDRADDSGAEPNLSTQPMWQSEDIWLRQSQDATHAFAHMHQNAEYRTNPSNPNYIYVEVHNRGGAASTGTEQLSLYWAKAGSALSWPSSWNGSSFFDSPANTMMMGASVGTVTIPVIAPGASAILEFSWMPPDPAVYSLPWLASDQNHFCLLSRITTSATSPFGMTIPETLNLYQNVQNNNNIVWKNIEVYNANPSDAPAYSVVGNMKNEDMKAKFKFLVVDENGETATNNWKIRVEALGEMKNILKQNHISGDGIKNLGDGFFEINKSDAELEGIKILPKTLGAFKMIFQRDKKTGIGKGFALNITQAEDLGGKEQIIGGQTFVFGQVKGFGTSPTDITGTGKWKWWYWIVILGALVGSLLIWRWKK